jgi:hypothetical protein
MTNALMLDLRKPWLCALLTAFSILSPAYSQIVPGTMDVHWNEGSKDCIKNPQPPLQVHRYNAQTFILRESLCATYEAPFIYLLIGKTKALLIDTGGVADAKTMPAGSNGDFLVVERGIKAAANGRAYTWPPRSSVWRRSVSRPAGYGSSADKPREREEPFWDR